MIERASIRYKNPGAMWGRTGKRSSPDREVPTNNPLALRWGSKRTFYLSDGLGQGNNIAEFPTYVDGICAQLDLWRTSPRYRNKKFKDAIAVWSGGNNVESYVRFVLQRVPGMTRDTIMNDNFWRSAMGLSFLKAQAGHEAGKTYPASDGDWIEAQRRVFASEPVKSTEDPRPGLAAGGDLQLYDNQAQLKSMNYNPGGLDGVWGGGTAGAIAAFLNDRDPTIAPPTTWQSYRAQYKQIDAVIDAAEADGFRRPVTQGRATADPEVMARAAPEIVPAKHGFWGAIGAFFSALGGSIYSCINWLTGYRDQVEQWGLMQYVDRVPTFVWLLLVAALIGFIVYKTIQTVRGIEAPVQTGERM